MRLFLLRILVILVLVLGVNYLAWRWLFSLNTEAWWISLALVLAETYSLLHVLLFGLAMWRARSRALPPPAPEGVTVDVFITTCSEPLDLVARTARAARDIRYPHQTWILDDGNRPEVAAMAHDLGLGYITRGDDWANRPLHAKAGNLNNALMNTEGEFLLILDADQVPHAEILDHTLGYFANPQVALVQTPQVFGNLSTPDPLGSQAPLFYRPIQQGKDGWNAAVFCGSNAVLRREALMQLGVTRYVRETEQAVARALSGASRVLAKARRSADAQAPVVQTALAEVAGAIDDARGAIRGGVTLGEATYALQQRIGGYTRGMVESDVRLLALDLAAIREMHTETTGDWDVLIDVDKTVETLASRDLSPLGALESVQALLRSLDVDNAGEALPLMPLATMSATEDMATSMRLHGLGWHTVYHDELLAEGRVSHEPATMLARRLRWSQGTLQALLRENPLVQAGLSTSQRLMYFATLWSYLGGFAAVVYLAVPVVFLVFGILPVAAAVPVFFLHFLPFFFATQLLFFTASRGVCTWRGQRYNLALFPLWIHATVTAVGNVFFGAGLRTPVPRAATGDGPQWHLIKPQIVAACVLGAAVVIGGIRLALGLADPLATALMAALAVIELVMLGVLVPMVRYQGFEPDKKVPAWNSR